VRHHGGARKWHHAERHRLFRQDLEYLSDVAEIVCISAEHEVNFLPPEAND